MFKKAPKKGEGLFKGLMMAYSILLLHVLLIAGLGLMVVFLTGLITYMFWIVMSGILLVALSGYLFYRRLRAQGKSLGETLREPEFRGRSLEVSVMGGLVTMRLGKPEDAKSIEAGSQIHVPRLEDPASVRLREIQTLVDLLEKDLITREEFDRAKHHLLG